MACYRVTVLGSKRTGKSALSHFMVTMSSLPQYKHTEEVDMKYIQFVHSEIGNCFLLIEDTPGWSPGDRKEDFPDLLTEKPMTYMFTDSGVKKAGMPPPPDVNEIPWWAFWDDGVVKEPPPEVEDTPSSPLDGKGMATPATEKRQAFIVVYSVKDEASFKEAEQLLADLMASMEPEPGEMEEDDKKKINEEEVDKPPFPIVLVSTHNDLKKNGPGARVDSLAGSDLANGFGLPFFECNAKGLGVNDAFNQAISAIQACEDNMSFDYAPGVLSRCKAQCCVSCPEKCCYPQPCVEKMCPNQEQPDHPCAKANWDKRCCWKNAP